MHYALLKRRGTFISRHGVTSLKTGISNVYKPYNLDVHVSMQRSIIVYDDQQDATI